MKKYDLSIDDWDLIKKAEKITKNSYEPEDISTVELLMYVIDDLVYETEKLHEALIDLEADLNENYRPLTQKELIGYNVKDFI